MASTSKRSTVTIRRKRAGAPKDAKPSGAPPATAAASTTPSSPRGRRTREALLKAAREIFERDGYINTRVTDIADRAKVAHGTFYTYFDSKHDVFYELAQSAVQELDRVSLGSEEARSLPPRQALREVARQYLRAYRSQAPILALIDQAATYGEELGALRDEVRLRLAARNEQVIGYYQRAGLADTGMDPHYAGAALGSMMSGFAYDWLVLGADFDEDQVVETISRIWAGAIGLREDDSGA